MTLWFDMDGTIADFYGVKGWLDYLQNEDTTPYAVAKPLLNMRSLARKLNTLARKGHKIGIVSWTSKTGTPTYNSAVAEVKRKWLKKHLGSVKFDTIDILPYGTPKQVGRTGILFDDEEKNRISWGANAYTEKEIFEVLRRI